MTCSISARAAWKASSGSVPPPTVERASVKASWICVSYGPIGVKRIAAAEAANNCPIGAPVKYSLVADATAGSSAASWLEGK